MVEGNSEPSTGCVSCTCCFIQEKPCVEGEDPEGQQGWCHRHFHLSKFTQTAWHGLSRLEKASRIVKPNL